MSRLILEKFQILFYLSAIALGLGIGSLAHTTPQVLDALLWPLLGLLLYSTFTQVPLEGLWKQGLADRRFLWAAVTGNFLLLPLLVLLMTSLLPDSPGLRLGVLLVLLVPCTDWFITFTQLGGGDTRRAIAFAPVSLLLQMLCLPAYLWFFSGESAMLASTGHNMLLAFGGLILLPLALAYLTRKNAHQSRKRQTLLEGLGWLPVPLLSIVVCLIAITQVHVVLEAGALLLPAALAFIAFLVVAALAARLMAHCFRLPVQQGRVLAFSYGTRNSFVVLPLALALPQGYELAVSIVVLQSLIELFGMVLYLWWVPTRLFPPGPQKAHPGGE
ncbi:arsenic resistance protein [Desulfurispirillum indicum]|uniref:arsenic resistance protein n=1 Tax=Desulfurispirillum indicum TaxID=936456 RepID=UPI001CFC2EA2|nr:arsenic resistance protein [Desulfurispirillum indicum]UCZ55655.1 arsenic resistance protein [Desulfurispirillum indicum]